MNYFIVDAFIQGEAMGRPSVIATRIKSDGNIFVGGTAAIVAEGNFSYLYRK
jgi:predicted PhzF superfamily epimerase YddE/YHI9